MKTRLILSSFLVLMIVAVPVHADVYKWKDAKGNTVISDTPQPGSGQPVVRSEGGTPVPGDTAAANQPKSLADQELEFRKRQQEKQEANAKLEKEKIAADEKRAKCERARKTQATLQSSRSLRSLDAEGKVERYGAAQRQTALEAANRAVQQNCN